MSSNDTRREIGYVRSVRPGQRRLRVAPLPGCEPAFENLAWIYILPEGAEVPVHCRVTAVDKDANGYIVTLNPGVTRDRVALMKGAQLKVESQELGDQAPAQADELIGHLSDFEGFDVVDPDGNPVGTVTEVYATELNGAFEITRPNGSAVMAPAIPQVIVQVDLENRRLTVSNLEEHAVESS